MDVGLYSTCPCMYVSMHCACMHVVSMRYPYMHPRVYLSSRDSIQIMSYHTYCIYIAVDVDNWTVGQLP